MVAKCSKERKTENEKSLNDTMDCNHAQANAGDLAWGNYQGWNWTESPHTDKSDNHPTLVSLAHQSGGKGKADSHPKGGQRLGN